MGTTLTGKKRSATYTWLLQLGSAGLSVAKRVLMGDGTDTALVLASDHVGIAANHTAKLDASELTADRLQKLPNKAGTFAMLSDLPTLNGIDEISYDESRGRLKFHIGETILYITPFTEEP